MAIFSLHAGTQTQFKHETNRLTFKGGRSRPLPPPHAPIPLILLFGGKKDLTILQCSDSIWQPNNRLQLPFLLRHIISVVWFFHWCIGTASNENESVPWVFRWKPTPFKGSKYRSNRLKNGNYTQLFGCHIEVCVCVCVCVFRPLSKTLVSC